MRFISIRLVRLIYFYLFLPVLLLPQFFMPNAVYMAYFLAIGLLWVFADLNMRCSKCRSLFMYEQKGEDLLKDYRWFGIPKHCECCGNSTSNEYPWRYRSHEY